VDEKTVLTPAEWYGLKREHPERYEIIKEYVIKAFPFQTIHRGGPPAHTSLLIPRTYFTLQLMRMFLDQYWYLREYQLVLIDNECDYYWSEIKSISARLENLLSSETDR
jgi:hypothetical protein